jgi:hypothetical protein
MCYLVAEEEEDDNKEPGGAHDDIPRISKRDERWFYTVL